MGIRLALHKSKDRVWIFTEDAKRDRAPFLPDVVAEARRILPESVILDCEMVWWKRGQPIPRRDMIAVVTGKEPIKGEDIRFNCFDCLYLDGEDLTGKEWQERQAALKRALPKDGKHLFRVPNRIVDSKAELQEAIRWASTEAPGSEGAMLKIVSGPGSQYDTTGKRTMGWAKLRIVLEIAVQVIGKRLKEPSPLAKKPPRTYEYIVAIKRGRQLIPIEAKAKVAPKDIEREKERPPRHRWKFAPGWKPREVGQIKYGKTYTTNIDAKFGDIITVQPVKILRWEDTEGREHFSWIFPTVKELRPERTQPDDRADILRYVEEATPLKLTERVRRLLSRDIAELAGDVLAALSAGGKDADN